jgi:rhodanese-related sulfurtransferase
MKKPKNYTLDAHLSWTDIKVNIDMKEITVEELKKKKDKNEDFILLDIRELHEQFISDMDGTIKIPLDDLSSRISELDKNRDIITLCRSGNRSQKAAQILIENGFDRVANLKGGINDWAKKIDPSLPEY